ncbi:MAG: response regulator transcription factor [Candidatus Desulfofervidaceae bacterium]|nr:response regulator transcription factor [Candidatus Desulfofervidaceae bacterium]MDL1971019.1 response regulator transcription factor [Candidatus Desulfofervidaceae bacterium]
MTVFIVDDEPDICELVSLHLGKSGFKVKSFLNASDFLETLSSQKPDLIVLDLMLPDMDGLEICKYLKTQRETADIPIIMLTARGEDTDKVLGLELGADDYVTKPFSPRELIARVKAVLRRAQTAQSSPTSLIQIGNILVIDPQRYEVFVGGEKIALTPTEFKILLTLAQRKGWVFTREQLLEILWGQEKAVLDRTIDVHIKNLREKLRTAGRLIKSIRGIGYKIEEGEAA